MRTLGLCVGTVLAAAVGGAGCHTGGVLTGAGGAGTLSGAGGKAGGSGGIGTVVQGTGGVGPVTGSAGFPITNCGGPPKVADRVPPKIMFLVDTSASMNDGSEGSCTGGCGSRSKWSTVVGGIDAVVGSDGPLVSWGLKFIGAAGDVCDARGVDVSAGPGSASAVISALAGRTAAGQLAVTGSTPTRAAVNACVAHLQGLTTPGRMAIMLVTDGQPDCGLDAADPRGPDTAAALQAITTGEISGVATYVVGVGALDAATDDALSMMAVAGGAPHSGAPAYYPVAGANDLVNVINQVVDDLGACTFAIPAPEPNDGTSRDNIAVYANGVAIPQDPNNGWTFDDSSHTTLTLHGVSCDGVRAGTLWPIMIVFLCLIG